MGINRRVVESNNLKPLISVIMPTYNQASYIAEAIKSVLSQSYANIELIIVDNYSSDGTKEIVSSFQDERIKYFQFHNNGIIASARNFAVKHATGDVLAFLDSDDVWLLNKLDIQLEHLLEENICCVATNFIPIGDVVYCRHHLDFSSSETFRNYDYEEISLANPVMTSSTIVWKKDFDEASGFDESPDFRFIEDWELWLRLSTKGRVRVLAEPLIKYRVIIKKDRDLRDVSKRTLKIFERHYEAGIVDLKLKNRASGNCDIRIGKSFLDMNDRRGIHFYFRGLLWSRGFHNKVRAVIGIILFAFPELLRNFITRQLYKVNHSLFSRNFGKSM